MALQMGPFGVPTPESVFADYEEKQRKEIENIDFTKNTNFNISFTNNCNYNDYDEEYEYDRYNNEYFEEAIDDLKYQLYSLEYSNKKLKEENEKLNERLNQLENSQLRNVIVRI